MQEPQPHSTVKSVLSTLATALALAVLLAIANHIPDAIQALLP